MQNTITRMSTNSFMIKGWCITLVSALFALATQGANKDYVLVAYFIIPVFGVLDVFFISCEKRYRALYDKIRKQNTTDFDMNINQFNKMLGIQKNEFLCELLFLELIGECRKEEVDRLYTRELKKYIEATSSYVTRQRLLYAYAKLFLNDDAEAAKARKKYEETCLSYPFEGEIAGNNELIDLVDDLAVKKK